MTPSRLLSEWWRVVRSTNTLGLAAQVAFWVFLSLLPLAAVAGLLVARLAFLHPDVEAALFATFPAPARALLASELARVSSWNGGAVGPLAAVTFVWLASGGIQAVFDALELQTGAPRPWWRRKALALASCVAISVAAVAIAVLAAGATWTLRFLQDRLAFDWTAALLSSRAARLGMSFVVATATVVGLYRVGVPRSAHGPRCILIGALFAVLFDALSAWGYGLALRLAGTASAYSAGLAAIGATMTTLYLLALGVLAGASLNQVLSRASVSVRSSPGSDRAPAPGDQREDRHHEEDEEEDLRDPHRRPRDA